jgi:hypothetical protein
MTAVPSNSELAVKRRKWLEVLGGNDQHSIGRQLAQIAWDFASFAVVNEARRLAAPHPSAAAPLNGLLHELLDRGFFTSQLLAIRRLADSEQYPLEGNRATWSVTALLADMAKDRNLLTRKAIFEAEGLQYDHKVVEAKWAEWCNSAPQGPRRVARMVPPELNYHLIVMRHRDVSRLAGIASAEIKDDDAVKAEVFDDLAAKVKTSSSKVNEHVNKYLAHAAAPGDRVSIDPEAAGVTLNLLKESHKCFCQVASFLSIFVLGDAHPNFLPVPQYNLYEYIERPLVDSSHVGLLKKAWDDVDREWHEWTHWGLDGYEEELRRDLKAAISSVT